MLPMMSLEEATRSTTKGEGLLKDMLRGTGLAYSSHSKIPAAMQFIVMLDCDQACF